VTGLRDRIGALDSADLALRLTLLGLVLHPVGHEFIRPWILGMAGAGLLFPALLRQPTLWGALTLLTASRVALDWPLSDNHAYLLSYWCLAVAISCCSKEQNRVLALNGRWLIALVFGFAVLWKGLLAPDFVDGTFFRVTLLVDPRFEALTQLVGGLSIEQIDAARAAFDRHSDGGALEAVAAATPSVWLDQLAMAITAWTLAIELAIAVTFCWWQGRGPSKQREAFLILFCVSTYSVATVEGFGWLLIAMGVAQCEADRVRTRIAFLATFALILFYREVSWLRWLADLIGDA
jgi:hypothetical protein